jgi:ATP-dependent helicase HrpA
VGGEFPRSPDAFAKLHEGARGKWHEAAVKISDGLEEVIEGEREIREWITSRKKDRNYGEIADDLDEQLMWLMRGNFAWRAGYVRFLDYPRHFRAIRSRLARLTSLPLVRDLEKMEKLRLLWSEWFSRWGKESEKVALWEVGWLMMEWRISLFAPDVGLRGKVSEKRVAEELGKFGG